MNDNHSMTDSNTPSDPSAGIPMPPAVVGVLLLLVVVLAVIFLAAAQLVQPP